MSTNYRCDNCNKVYKTYSGLWKHQLKICISKSKPNVNLFPENGNVIQEKVSTQTDTKIKCKYCDKDFKSRQSKWKHEKACENTTVEIPNNKINELMQKLTKIETDLEDVKNKPTTITNINKGTINKGPVYNFLTSPGSEDINILSEQEIEHIMDQEMNCLIALVDMLNFNEKHPENHSFCNTALHDKYISTLNPETLTIEKQRKTDFFDIILNNGLKNMKLLYDKTGPQMRKKIKVKKYKETIDNLSNFLLMSNKGKKTYVELMNMLTFNKRHITQSTWQQLMNNQLPIEKTDKLKNQKKSVIELQDSDSDDDLDSNYNNDEITYSVNGSDSISDNDSEDEPIDLVEMTFQKNKYLFDGLYLYQIDVNEPNKKGKLFGKLINGKIRKLSLELDI